MSDKTQSLRPAKTQEEVWHRLRAPFKRVHWRVGSVSMAKRKVQLLAYLDARDVQVRLDEVMGPFGWSTTFESGASGGVVCNLSLLAPDPYPLQVVTLDHRGPMPVHPPRWVTKADGADNTDIEAIKGGMSGAFKRAAVNWGIGRYLYSLDNPWSLVGEKVNKDDIYVNYWDKKTKTKLTGHVVRPSLPRWATPGGYPPLSSPVVSVDRGTGGDLRSCVCAELGVPSGEHAPACPVTRHQHGD